MLLANGIGIADVAAYLGDRPETIAATYCHPTGVRPAVVISGLLRGSKVQGGGDK
jgi:hypothetical protein